MRLSGTLASPRANERIDALFRTLIFIENLRTDFYRHSTNWVSMVYSFLLALKIVGDAEFEHDTVVS